MIRHIEIDACLNGFIVRVGCQTIVFESVGALVEDLGAYLDDPEAMEIEYATALNARHTLNASVNPTPVGEDRAYTGQAGQCTTGLGNLGGAACAPPSNREYR
jgi:hypothetical protein